MAQSDATRIPDELAKARPIPAGTPSAPIAAVPSAELSAVQRRHMVDGQIRTYDVHEPALLEVLYDLPREVFLPAHLQSFAYADCPLNVGGPEKRELLAPMVLARMIQAATLAPEERVLDVAGGTGYTAAIFAKLGAKVTALESDPVLSAQARSNCDRLGLTAVQTIVGPLAEGYRGAAPYDVIFINGAVEQWPKALFEQMAENGRLLLVEMSASNRPARSAKATVFVRSGDSVSPRPLFDACAALLQDFRKKAEFVF
jgi:protein-L-isoaspartate(D-aspartate) O-methyltransferase